jgi:hypothetical protein
VDHLQTRQHLESQRARLRKAASITACQFARTQALQYIARINGFLSAGGDLSCVAGLFGKNGYGPGIEMTIRDCEAHTREAEVAAIVARARAAA